MAIPKDTIQQIKDAIDIVEVVEDFVPLKKKGSNWWALSPFSNEKTPSFAVSPTKGIFKDFSSGKAGDSITFVMEMEGLNYVEALKYLAKKYNIEIAEEEASPAEQEAQKEKDSLLIVLNFAAKFYAETLSKHEEGKAIGLSYLKERGITQNTIEAFGLGYSLDRWHAFEEEATKKGYKADFLEKAGLVVVKEDKRYDRFRGRIMFPIHNLSGKVIGFGARTLRKADKPKYLNSPESEVYHKSEVLYGLHQAKNAIRNANNSYLVEGYTDVLSLYQNGIENVVASSGTALTPQQIASLKRFTSQVTLLYDGDAAGLKAAERGVDIILEKGLDVKIVAFPEGEDPDSYIRKVGKAAFKEFVAEEAKDFILFKTNQKLRETKDDPTAKAGAIRDIVETIIKIPDLIKRSVFYKQCSSLLDIEEQLLVEEGDRILEEKEQKRLARNRRQEQDSNPFTFHDDIPAPEDAPPPDLTEILQETERNLSQEKSEYYQEKEFVRLLVAYGERKVESEKFLFQYLFDELGNFVLEHELFSRVLGIYKEVLADGELPTEEVFIHHENEEVKQLCIDMLQDKYFVSQHWEKKYKIFVPDKDEFLNAVVYTNIMRLKFRKVEKLCENALTLLQDATTIEAQLEQQKLYMELKKQKDELAKELGMVIS